MEELDWACPLLLQAWDSEENTLVSSICHSAFLKPHRNSIWINRDKQYREVLRDGSCLLDGAHGAQSWDTLRFRIKPECPVKPILPLIILFFFFSQILASSQESARDWGPGRSSPVPWLHPDCGQGAKSRQEDAPVFSPSLIQGDPGHRLCAGVPEVSAGSQGALTSSQATESPFCSYLLLQA